MGYVCAGVCDGFGACWCSIDTAFFEYMPVVYMETASLLLGIGEKVCVHPLPTHLTLEWEALKFRLLGRWEGYQPTSSTLENKKPWFQVEIFVVLPNKKSPCEVSVKLKEDVSVCYRMESLGSKSSCRIVDQDGGVVAEVKRKQTLSGVVLGEDVLTLVVEPHVDHSLISGLVVVYGLMNHTL